MRYEQKEKERLERQKEQEEILSTLPFIQIKKTKIALTDPNTTLFIIGNGFDIMHGVPSSYYSFRDSMGRHNELREMLEMYIRKEDLWADFEECLAYLHDEAMLGTINDWMDTFDVKNEYDYDFSAADFFMAAETAIAPAQIIIGESLDIKFSQYFIVEFEFKKQFPYVMGKALNNMTVSGREVYAKTIRLNTKDRTYYENVRTLLENIEID